MHTFFHRQIGVQQLWDGKPGIAAKHRLPRLCMTRLGQYTAEGGICRRDQVQSAAMFTLPASLSSTSRTLVLLSQSLKALVQQNAADPKF